MSEHRKVIISVKGVFYGDVDDDVAGSGGGYLHYVRSTVKLLRCMVQ